MTAPILLIAFNRPLTTAKVVQALLEAKPTRLYVATDGPREGVTDDVERCAEVRRIINEAPWQCEVSTLFRDRNLGCREAVVGAINWLFENETEGIILEDDCLPSPDFVPFCSSLLERYQSDHRVMAICGSNYVSDRLDWPYDYYFSNFSDPWGWATWRRAWKLYDADMSGWKEFKQFGGLRNEVSSYEYEWFWSRTFDKIVASLHLTAWDIQWIFSCMRQEGLVVYPTANLISNIGFGADATHTRIVQKSNPLCARSLELLPLPLRHPTGMLRVHRFEEEIRRVRLEIPVKTPVSRLWLRFRALLGDAARSSLPRKLIEAMSALR